MLSNTQKHNGVAWSTMRLLLLFTRDVTDTSYSGNQPPHCYDIYNEIWGENPTCIKHDGEYNSENVLSYIISWENPCLNNTQPSCSFILLNWTTLHIVHYLMVQCTYSLIRCISNLCGPARINLKDVCNLDQMRLCFSSCGYPTY